MSLINISNLTFCYDGTYENIFENISFSIDTNWKIGLVGRNGRGKTTLLKLLLGEYEYNGNMDFNVKFQYFPFYIKDKNRITIDVLMEINPQMYDWEIIKEMSYLNLDIDILYRYFDTLSNGEQTKILLACLFLTENGFLLIDEPTNHLDIETRNIVAKYLNRKKGFILVSHDRDFLDKCIDHIISINKENVQIQRGNYSSWEYNKNLEDNYDIQKNENIKKDIKKLDIASKKVKNWSDKIEDSKIGNGPLDRGYIGHKSAKMMKRSKNIEKRLEKSIDNKKNLMKNIDSAESLKMHNIRYIKDELILLKDIAIFYGENNILENITFSIKNGDRLFLKGKNGSGKSSLLKLIMGESIKYTGDFKIGSNLKISYIFQDTSNLNGMIDEYIQKYNLDGVLFRVILRKLGFSREMFEKDIKTYSQGQKKKVLISKSLCEKAHLYIWDEPLNFIDILTRKQIEEVILKYNPTIICVEHDKRFLERVSTKIIEL